jgi:sterol desaturase/sphingolipid hydroxylase (fatty acid hydroxylase superfamily)
MLIKIVAVTAMGAPAWSVVVFEVLLNGTAMFNHSNVSLPLGLDRVIRLLIVTPDMHRVHHSVIIKELNTNFGFNLSIWDRIFGTYTPQPKMGHQDMTLGLSNFRKFEELGFADLMALPFTVEKERL